MQLLSETDRWLLAVAARTQRILARHAAPRRALSRPTFAKVDESSVATIGKVGETVWLELWLDSESTEDLRHSAALKRLSVWFACRDKARAIHIARSSGFVRQRYANGWEATGIPVLVHMEDEHYYGFYTDYGPNKSPGPLRLLATDIAFFLYQALARLKRRPATVPPADYKVTGFGSALQPPNRASPLSHYPCKDCRAPIRSDRASCDSCRWSWTVGWSPPAADSIYPEGIDDT